MLVVGAAEFLVCRRWHLLKFPLKFHLILHLKLHLTGNKGAVTGNERALDGRSKKWLEPL